MSNRGFTLVELLVTVAVIGILASTAVASFQEYRVSAYNVAAKQVARNVAIGIEAYASITEWDASSGDPDLREIAINSDGTAFDGDVAFSLPGYTHTKGVAVNYLYYHSIGMGAAYSGHCKSTNIYELTGGVVHLLEGYDNWFRMDFGFCPS